MKKVEFNNCKLVGIDFSKCQKLLVSFNFINSFLQICEFRNLNLKKISFLGSKFKEVQFLNDNLTKVNFANTEFIDTIFNKCDLTKANFVGSKNYLIDPTINIIKKAKFSFPEVLNILKTLDIEIDV